MWWSSGSLSDSGQQRKWFVPAEAKKTEIVDGFTIKYHANGKTRWSKGKVVDGNPDGYWEWYRPDGTLKRSGHFDAGNPVGEWTTYDQAGAVYKVTDRGNG
jgi:antitoxin component YwqK of YwqJK toxin-antitoxin module